MPETAESLSFDENGVCSVCQQISYKKEKIDWNARARELDSLIEQYRGKYDYDCIVPFSGGKDSTFTLWYLVRVKNLKPLVVCFDHGFLREQVKLNAERTFRHLGVDAIRFTPNWKVVRKLMFESLRRRGDFCWHCHTGIFSYPMWVALKFEVPLLFWGEPGAEYSSFFSYDEKEEADEIRFNRKINLGINAEDMLGMLDNTISDYEVTVRDLKPYVFPPMRDLRQANIRSVFLGYYIPWDVKEHVEIIKNELCWEEAEVEGVPPQYGYEKIECFLQGVRDYAKYLKRGFGRTTHLCSIDIRNGRLSREAGADFVAAFDGRRPKALDQFLDILGISEEMFVELLKPHVVTPHEMPACGNCPMANRVPSDILDWKPELG